jgi:hypothetical protein
MPSREVAELRATSKIDRSLLERNKLNIMRMYLSDDIGNATEQIEKNEQGTLVKKWGKK